MDHATSHDRCREFAEKRRKAEPYIFFFGVVILVLAAISAVLYNGAQPVGPESAQHWAPGSAH